MRTKLGPGTLRGGGGRGSSTHFLVHNFCASPSLEKETISFHDCSLPFISNLIFPHSPSADSFEESPQQIAGQCHLAIFFPVLDPMTAIVHFPTS